jgi:dephospho-CoA kinase
MVVIGLTGSIGMGKSTVAKMMKGFGLPVYSADEAVHEVMKKGGSAVRPVRKFFPESIKKGAVDRMSLSRSIASDPRRLRQLERIIHPLIRESERAFLKKAKERKAPAVVLEIPLLFETGAEKRCDVVLCVSSPRKIQKERVLGRKGMTEEKFRALIARQMPSSEKCKRANYVVPTGTTLAETKDSLRRLLVKLGL